MASRETKDRLAERILACPKCKCDDIWVDEISENTSQHRVTGGVWVHFHDNNEPGNVVRIKCECEKCGHKWVSHRGLDFGNYFLKEI
jgi:predicted nucleic-acid-binding Zn-ribbon protein